MINLIFYTDGSSRGNPGFSGFGVFGYSFCYSDKPKNVSVPEKNFYFTDVGIQSEKGEKPIEVLEVIEVIKAISSDNSTNNHAELSAVICALEKIKEFQDVGKVVIYTDSGYIANSFNEKLEVWKNNGWKRQDNKQLIHYNEWKKIDEWINSYKELGIDVSITWIKGHSDSHGNNIADLYSRVGSQGAILLKENRVDSETILEHKLSYNDYKKSFIDKDFILFFKELYFSSDVNENDKNYCFIASSEEQARLGKRDSSAIFATNIGFVPNMINRLKALFRSEKRNYRTICGIKLSYLSDKELLRLFYLLDPIYLVTRHIENGSIYYSLVNDSGSAFVYECKFNFPFIVEASKIFNNMLHVREESENIERFDVTEQFIDKNKKKLIITNKDKVFDFSYLLKTPRLKQKILAKVGYDIVPYLALKKIEKEIERIELIFKYSDNFLTLYFNIITRARVILCCNVERKYLI